MQASIQGGLGGNMVAKVSVFDADDDKGFLLLMIKSCKGNISVVIYLCGGDSKIRCRLIVI